MANLENDLYLRAALRKPVGRTPVWMMRQAGRYLPEYRLLRSKAGDFMDLCKNPQLACEVTMQPLDRYPLDAAILFSDILTIPDAMELGLSFMSGGGPHFSKPVRSKSDINNLPIPDPEDKLSYVLESIRMIRKSLNNSVPLIGFAGSPWTLATYMVEGCPSKEYRHIKGIMYSEPKSLHLLLQKLTDCIILYLNAQVSAGAQALMIFDTWGGVLTPGNYREYSLHYMEKIINSLTREADGRTVPITIFTKNAGQWLEMMAATGADCLAVDWTIDLSDARTQIGSKVALQGNLDPAVLYGTDDRIREEVATVLKSYGHGSGHVFNLGHGIQQFVNPEKVSVMLEAVREMSPAYHS